MIRNHIFISKGLQRKLLILFVTIIQGPKGKQILPAINKSRRSFSKPHHNHESIVVNATRLKIALHLTKCAVNLEKWDILPIVVSLCKSMR